MNITTTDQLKEIAEERGSHFFDEATLAFFQSKIEPEIFPGNYFLTSEQPPTKDVWDGERRWTIRQFNIGFGTCNITSVSEFGAYQSKAQALEALKQLA